jgi:hypothetical protein
MAKRFKRKGCKEYLDLYFVFDDATTPGAHAHSSPESPSSGKE